MHIHDNMLQEEEEEEEEEKEGNKTKEVKKSQVHHDSNTRYRRLLHIILL